jgi:hypothetical protein
LNPEAEEATTITISSNPSKQALYYLTLPFCFLKRFRSEAPKATLAAMAHEIAQHSEH